jgi:hypothetical protein
MNNLYYRPTVRSSRRNFNSKSRYFKFVVPFIGLLLVIFLFWGLGKLWSAISNMKGTSLTNSAVVYIAEGMSAQKQNFGSSQFLPTLSGEILLEGDSIRTLQNTKVVLEFFNGLVVRLDEGTSVTIDLLDNKRDSEDIEISVTSGQIWLNKPEAIKTSSNLVVNTNYMRASTIGTVFGVKAGLPEQVAVIDGAVLVDIVDASTGTMLDQVSVSADQQITLDNSAYDAFSRRETPRVLSEILSSFSSSTWYKWNVSEDANPSNFSADASLRESNDSYIDQIDESLILDESGEVDEAADTRPKPEIDFPVNADVITTDTVVMTGTVPADTQAVVVTSFESDEANPYVLKEFKPGDTTFKYIAKYNADLSGNLRIGTNKFEVKSVDANGVESPAAKVEFELEIEGETATPESDNSDNSDDSAEAETTPTVSIDDLEFDESLAAPTLVSVNDTPASSGFVLKEPRAVVVGSIGKWAKSVVVNGYKLSQYEPYSGTFSYILSPGFSTLKAGENVVTAYGFDDENNRGKPMKITINYQP